jgi:hypothetical protein
LALLAAWRFIPGVICTRDCAMPREKEPLSRKRERGKGRGK